MQIERIKFFLAVAKEGSIKRASEKINISQQALSQSMSVMEKELGITLFERSKKGIVLTAAGEKAQESFREICFIYENLMRNLQEEKGLEKQIAIGIAPYMEEGYYVKVLNYIKWKYPNSKIQMMSVYDFEAAKLLEQHNIDFAVVSIKEDIDDFLLVHSELFFFELEKIKLFALINKKQKNIKHNKISFSQMEVHYSQGSGHKL